MPLEISDIVDVSAQTYAGGVARADFGRGLFLTTDDTLDAGGSGKVGVYSSLRALQAVFASDSEPYKAGSIWFAQDPHPRPLLVGRWAKSAVSTIITGGTPSDAGDIDDLNAATFSLGGYTLTPIDFSGAANHTAQAAALQAALRVPGTGNPPLDPRFTDAIVTFADGAFKIEFPSHGDFGELPTGTAAVALGLSSDEGAVYRGGSDSETAVEALAAIEEINDSWYWIMVEAAEADDTIIDISRWAAGNRKMFSAGNSQESALTKTGDDPVTMDSSFAARAATLQHARAPISWSRTADYLPVSMAARMSSVRFEQPNSLITAKFKRMPGIVPSDLTSAERDELVRKRVNHYTTYGSTPIYAEGVTPAPGMWIDIQYFLDWLVNAIETDLWNLLVSTPKIPQTDPGMAIIQNTLEIPFEQAVANGGLAPGILSPAMTADVQQSTGNHQFDGNLTKGYLIHIGALADQSQGQRESRIAPPITCWGKGSGAIHEASISFRFEQ